MAALPLLPVVRSASGSDAAWLKPEETPYVVAYRAMLEKGHYWRKIGNRRLLPRDLEALGRELGFEILVVVMSVIDIVGLPDPDAHPYAAQAKLRLEAAGIPHVSSFEIWARDKAIS